MKNRSTQRTALRIPAGWGSKPWLSIAVLVLVIGLRFVDPSTMERLRLAYFDFEQSASPRTLQDRHVVIVDIDQASLTAVGQWPWPRSTVAKLTNNIAAMQPAVIGSDVLLPLPDRLTPQEIVRSLPSINEATRSRLLSLPTNDALLAASFRKIPVVLGIAALPATAAIGNGSADPPVSVVAEAGADAGGYLLRSASLIANVAELDAAASGRGMVTLVPDDDGVLRRNPAAIAVRDRIFPSLAVEMARVAAGASDVTLVADNNGIESVRIGNHPLPTDPGGNLWLHYARPHTLQILSAADILAGRISPASIRGKLVLLGTTALAISGYHATPLGDRRSGVEIHAQLLQNIRDGDVLVRPDYISVAEILLLLVAGVVFIGAAWRLRGWRLLPLFLGLPALVVGIAVVAYLQAQLLIDPTLLAVLAILLYMSAATEGIIAEERARRQTEEQLRQALLQAETASKAKTDFLANMSHELRTPLTAILGFSDSIRNQLFGPISPPKYGDYVDQIHASGGHLLAIVNDVLDMSRIAAGDTGIGIAEADLDRIMEPFQIVENPQSRSYQGIGLGLPLARSLMQLHGGSLTLRSEIGIGTTATLTFPAARTIQSSPPQSGRASG